MADVILTTLLSRQPLSQEYDQLGNGTCHTIAQDSRLEQSVENVTLLR